MQLIVKKIAGIMGILYISTLHIFNKGYVIIILPDGIGEIINSSFYWDSIDTGYKRLLLFNRSRRQVINLVNCEDCKLVEVPDLVHKFNKSIIYSNFGKQFLKKYKEWVVSPIKDPSKIDFKKGFIWNIKDSMNAYEFNTRRLKVVSVPVKNNNIIYINPFARTVMEIPYVFFEQLAEELKKKGYEVRTILGNETQQPIVGTEGVVCGLWEAAGLINASSGLIGLRSGFMDWIASQTSRTVICLYPGNYPYIDFFSFKNLEYQNFIREVIVNVNDDYAIVINQIVEEW